jgi:hypothetical protein
MVPHSSFLFFKNVVGRGLSGAKIPPPRLFGGGRLEF